MGIFSPLRNWVDEFIPYHMEVGGKSSKKEVATPKTCFFTVLKEHLELWFRRVFFIDMEAI